MPALQAAGGLLLLLVAARLMLGTDDQSRHGESVEPMSIAMVPLATPLLAGPGPIVTTILFARQADTVRDIAAIGAGIAAPRLPPPKGGRPPPRDAGTFGPIPQLECG